MEQAPLIVGAGPTGLSAALFLAGGGVQSRIIDKAPAPSINSRAQVINPRSLELLQQTGVTDAILHEARPIHRVVFYQDWRPLTELEFGHAHPDFPMAVLPQARTKACWPTRSLSLVSYLNAALRWVRSSKTAMASMPS